MRTGGKAVASAGRVAAAESVAGVGGVVASPAPLTIAKSGPRSRVKGGPADENKAPGAAAGALLRWQHAGCIDRVGTRLGMLQACWEHCSTAFRVSSSQFVDARCCWFQVLISPDCLYVCL